MQFPVPSLPHLQARCLPVPLSPCRTVRETPGLQNNFKKLEHLLLNPVALGGGFGCFGCFWPDMKSCPFKSVLHDQSLLYEANFILVGPTACRQFTSKAINGQRSLQDEV